MRQNDEDHTNLAPKPSAMRVAILRAVHQLLDSPLIFEDPLAFKILGMTEEQALRNDPSRYDTPLLNGLRASIVVRSRLAEDEWAHSKQRGIRQFVILGAGLDTFAYRNQDHEGCRVFEVDLPTTQQWKRDCLHAAGIEEPAFLSFVTINLEVSTLANALKQAGFCIEEPAFFSWLGVTMYIEEEAILNTLRFVATLAPGTGVVFDYGVLPSLLSPIERKVLAALMARTSGHDEPWKTLFNPESIAAKLASLGFSEVTDYGPTQLNDRYFSGRKDGLHKSGVSRLICARI